MSDSCFTQFKLEFPEKKLAIGAVKSSENISAGGHLWRIDCYPRGESNEHNGEYVSMFLKLVSSSLNVKVIFMVFVTDRDGQPSLFRVKRFSVASSPPPGFPVLNNYWPEWTQFARRSDLESLYARNGWVTIMCGVMVERAKPLDNINDPLHVPASDIGSHLGHLLQSTDGSDVSFSVDGETFLAHRAVLAARSPVFKAQFLGSMAEAKMPSITLHDIDAATVKVMLRRFIYTDALPGDDEIGGSPIEVFQDLLAVADGFALDRLKLICTSKLWENVSADTFAAILSCAETYNCPELKKKCTAFFAVEKNFRKIVLTDGYIQLAQNFPSLLAELREKAGAERQRHVL